MAQWLLVSLLRAKTVLTDLIEQLGTLDADKIGPTFARYRLRQQSFTAPGGPPEQYTASTRPDSQIREQLWSNVNVNHYKI
jgi:hypothetical protein